MLVYLDGRGPLLDRSLSALGVGVSSTRSSNSPPKSSTPAGLPAPVPLWRHPEMRVGDKALASLADTCPHLESLNLTGCRQVLDTGCSALAYMCM